MGLDCVLVTGASGFVGRRLCEEIVNRGSRVKAALRGPVSGNGSGESVIVGRINGQTDWAAALQGVDVVIHLAACVHVMPAATGRFLEDFREVNVAGTVCLARACAAKGLKRLVYVSSTKVNGEATYAGNRFTETDIPAPQDPYAISKWEAEQALRRVSAETGLEIVIVRPPLVYGPGVKANFLQMLKVLANGIPLPLGAVGNLRSLIYVENLVDALILCATHPAAAGQVYLVSDGQDISTPDLLSRLGEAMGHPARLFPFPAALLKLAGRLIGKFAQVERLLGSLRVDDGKIRRELNWIPPYSLQQGLQATAAWYGRQASLRRGK